MIIKSQAQRISRPVRVHIRDSRATVNVSHKLRRSLVGASSLFIGVPGRKSFKGLSPASCVRNFERSLGSSFSSRPGATIECLNRRSLAVDGYVRRFCDSRRPNSCYSYLPRRAREYLLQRRQTLPPKSSSHAIRFQSQRNSLPTFQQESCPHQVYPAYSR